jgi:hypothetical protein
MQRLVTAIALAVAVSFSAVTIHAATDSLSAEAVETAESAAAQNAIADKYEAEAARLRAEAAKHEQMLRSYDRKPTYHKSGQKGSGMSAHCLKLIEQYSQGADDAAALARQHRNLAAEMALEAGDDEVAAVQQKAIAEQYTKEAARLREEAATHKAMKRAYESRPLYKKGQGSRGGGMVQHCDDLIAQYTAAAEQAEALAKMHMELAEGK